MENAIKKYWPVFLLPTLAAFIIGFIWPFLQGIYLSFCKFNVPSDAKWNGLSNYVKVFSDAGFANAFKNTAAFAVAAASFANLIYVDFPFFAATDAQNKVD